jgi:indolepyruvate decarboxylase
VVLINGTPSIRKTLTFEQTGVSSHHFITGRETDLQSFEHITAAAVRVDNPDLAPMLIDYALSRCITDRRPVYIELLQDMIDLSCPRPSGVLTPARAMSDPSNLQESITHLRERLTAAANPVVWVGVEVDRFGLHEKTLSLLHQLRIPYVTELLSKAVLSEDDTLFAGVFDGQASSAAVKDLIHGADLVLALGVWLTDINTLGWDVDFGRTAFVSLDTVKDGTFFSPQVALEHLIDGLLADPVNRPAPARPRVPSVAAITEPHGDTLTYQGFYDTVAHYVDENTIIGADASMNYFGSLLLTVPTAGGFVAQSSYSAIGYSAPAATGICLAKNDRQRVLVFSGDGGFQMTAQCLSVQTRFGLDPIIFVLNNGVYGVEQWLADASVFDTDKPFYKSCVLHPWNYSRLADVFGCQGWRATTYVELKEAVTGALANTGSPSIVEVVVDGKSIPDNATWKTN